MTPAEAISSALGPTDWAYELILVNDGSADRTWPTIERLCGADKRVVGIDLRRNFGQDNAIMTGLRLVRGEAVVIMDDDLQHHPGDIPTLLAALRVRGIQVPDAARERIMAEKDPEHLGSSDAAQQHYAQQAEAIVGYRNARSGIIDSIDNLGTATTPAILTELKQDAYLSGFAIRNVEIVGPQVGAQLKKQALLATLYSLAGMLVYLWFRFELIYGVAAVVAVFHDTLITVGAFSLTNQEVSLTVIAAILTLVGYSMNDTIVVFDRIRENIKLMRRERLDVIVNKSINQTLSRTILTSGLTFLTVLSLFVFGGEVLHGFSFALVIGILIGTYSSIAVAAPMLVAYTDRRARRGARTVAMPAGGAKKTQKAQDLRGVKARG